MRNRLLPALLLLVLLAFEASAASPANRCETAVASALGRCVAKVGALTQRCFSRTGVGCAANDPGVLAAIAALESKVLARCPDDASVQSAGFGALVTRSAVVERAREACLGEPATLAARTFGGPQGALLDGASADVRDCLDTAFFESAKLLKSTLRIQGACIRRVHAGRSCDVPRTESRLSALAAKAALRVEQACPMLPSLLRVSPAEHVARATAQAGCLTATAHGDPGPLALGCGPRPEVVVPARGQWVNVELDEATYGVRCGDGSPYRFWMRLAPAGQPAWRVVTDMQGGGVCLFEADCSGTGAGLFRADEGLPNSGYLSTNATVNPFSDWTMLFMPYCTQDLHIGGGSTSVFPSLSVERFGALNARAALAYLRDVLWAELEASDPEGWRPDRLRVMFAGESAGAFGVMYNYHHVLDELRWVNTTAVPDSGLGLGAGVGVLVGLFGGAVSPGWNLLPMLPPYCTAGDCMVGPVIEMSTSPRLEATPWQQILNVSNQVDSVQSGTTVFPNLVAWINAVRTNYCDERGQPGIHFFLPASSSSIHTMLRSNSQFTTLAAQGTIVRDYVFGAMTDPGAVVDRVDEGTIVVDRPGVNPIPCALPPP